MKGALWIEKTSSSGRLAVDTDEWPIGKRVVVLRLDSATVVGNGTIDGYVPYSEIETDSVGKTLADTERPGRQREVELSEILITMEDGSTVTADEALEEADWSVARILLDDGTYAYGPMCYFRALDESQQPEVN